MLSLWLQVCRTFSVLDVRLVSVRFCFVLLLSAISDYEAIVRIGNTDKLKDSSKTGKFGLGFNTVYHYTDVPSVVSGKNLMFAPLFPFSARFS